MTANFVGCTYNIINSMYDLFHSWTVCKLVSPKITWPFPQKSREYVLKLTGFDVDYKFIV